MHKNFVMPLIYDESLVLCWYELHHLHLCNILNNEDQDIRINIKDFFVALGCDTDRILLNKVSQQALNYDDFKNKEVLINEN